MGKYEAILKIAQYGNLTRAAQELGYVQSNLSHMVQRMENDLQIKIFHRDRQGVKLTRAGQELLDVMHKIETLEGSLYSVALAQRTSTLRIGTFSTVSRHWIPGILKRFYEKFPETSVFLTELDSSLDLDAVVRNGDVDCSFYAGTYHAGLDFFPLYRDPYTAVVSRENPLSTQTATTLSELSQYAFITTEEGIYGTLQELAQTVHFPPKLMTKTQEDAVILPLIAHNLCVGILPSLTTKSADAQICAIPLKEPLSREVGILCKPYGEISEVAKCFIQTAREFTATWAEEQVGESIPRNPNVTPCAAASCAPV